MTFLVPALVIIGMFAAHPVARRLARAHYGPIPTVDRRRIRDVLGHEPAWRKPHQRWMVGIFAGAVLLAPFTLLLPTGSLGPAGPVVSFAPMVGAFFVLGFVNYRFERLAAIEVLRRAGTATICPACSYDISGAPGATCPECGAQLAPVMPLPPLAGPRRR